MVTPCVPDHLDKATLEKLYWKQELTTTQIADRYGASASNVTILMHKSGIPRRQRGAAKT